MATMWALLELGGYALRVFLSLFPTPEVQGGLRSKGAS